MGSRSRASKIINALTAAEPSQNSPQPGRDGSCGTHIRIAPPSARRRPGAVATVNGAKVPFYAQIERRPTLGLTPTEYSSGVQQHRGQITKAGNTHARRLLIEAAWNYQHRPRQSTRAARLADQVPPEITARAWQAQTRLLLRHRALTANGKRSTVATTAVARELVGFIWAAMVRAPLRQPEPEVAAA